jgi:hypothetical protein
MKNFLFRRPLFLAALAVILAGVMPAQAVRLGKSPVYRLAVFQTASTAKIAVGTNYSASLLNLTVGDRVSIAYDQENGVLVAHNINDGVPPKPRNPGANSVSHHPSTASTLAHVHGIVEAVNAQAGTLSIAYRVR